MTAQNVATNAVRTQASNDVGAFTFPAMPPGVYLVKAELEGFKPAENRVELHVEQTLRVSFTLEIGGFTETTLVTGVDAAPHARKTRRSAPSSRTGASSSCRSTAATTSASSRSART